MSPRPSSSLLFVALVLCSCSEGESTAPAVDSAVDRFADSQLVRTQLDEDDVRALFKQFGAGVHVYDPYTYFAYPGNDEMTMRKVTEHPRGRVVVATNSLGLREDEEVASEQPDLRVLVAGDSHTDGVCFNEESFANVLEAELAARHPGRTIEVLNAGVGGFSFYHYLGTLEKFAELEPDVFVVACYGGNDFVECLKLWHHFDGSAIPERTKEYEKRRAAAVREVPDAGAYLTQSLSQVACFDLFPEEEAVARRALRAVTTEIARQCRERGVELVGLYIPPATRAQPHELADLDRMVELLGFDESSLGAADRLADAWLETLAELGAVSVDLRPVFRASESFLYWRFDHHIDVEGHRAAGLALLPAVEPFLDR